MERRFLVIFILTVRVWNGVQAKNFLCKSTSTFTCTITDVGPQDNIVLSSSYYQINQLTISNSTVDDIPQISYSRNLDHMNYLSCVGCGLPDITKHSFTQLKQLQLLNISFGTYTKLQKNLFSQLPSLKHLNVSHGTITQIDDAAFFNLNGLQELDLSHNNISRITSNMFTSLETMWKLDLSNNHIEVLEDALFTNNTKLNYLDLTRNNITRIDGEIFNPQHIVTNLVLRYNQLTTFNIRNLENVWLEHNKIKQLFISNSVQSLYAANNKIEKLNCDENGSYRITSLHLSYNSLNGLGCIGSLATLTSLNLNDNNLGKLNQSSFAELTKLTTLSLQSNNIGGLEYGIFSHQSQLQSLDISYNHMGNIALDMFLAARNLKSLYIDGNNITEFSYNDLKTAFTSFETISIGDNEFNCTFLAQAIKQLNSNNIEATFYGNKVRDSHNINGISCQDRKEIPTPSWIPNDDNGTSDATNTKVNIRLNAVIQQVDKLSQAITENDEKFKNIWEDINAIKQQIFKTNSDILDTKAEILKIELSKSNNSTTSSNAMWTQINQLNNITLEKQQISSRVQAQEINELKFDIEKNSQKLSDCALKIEKLMKEVATLQSTSALGSTNHIKESSASSFDLIKNVNIILITLIVTFCIYKGYKFVKNDLPRVRRYNTTNTLHTNIEMDNSS